MFWALLVAVGVGVVSMTIFGARLTRRQKDEVLPAEEFDPTHDPNDPWAAWKPRPFEEVERRRPRAWPLLAGLTGLLMVGAGFAGARQELWSTPVSAQPPEPTANAALIEVEAPPTPTPAPTPEPTPAPTRAPSPARSTPAPAPAQQPDPTAAPEPQGPSLTANATCGADGAGPRLSVTYEAQAAGAALAYFSVFVNGEIIAGGPISGNTYSGGQQTTVEPGSHDVEVVFEDAAGRSARRVLGVNC